MKFIRVEKRLFLHSHQNEWDIGEGAIVNLDLITKPLANFLRLQYFLDSTCLSGDIFTLLQMGDDFINNHKVK